MDSMRPVAASSWTALLEAAGLGGPGVVVSGHPGLTVCRCRFVEEPYRCSPELSSLVPEHNYSPDVCDDGDEESVRP